MHYIQPNPQLDYIYRNICLILHRQMNSFLLTGITCMHSQYLTAHSGQYNKHTSKNTKYSAFLMQSGDSCPCKAWEHGNEGIFVSLAQLRLPLPMLSPTNIPICAHLCPSDLCARPGWAFRSILGGMKALSSLAGHDIISHSARKVMTGSNPYWINAFMKAPLFPWSHTIPGLQSPETWRTTVYPTQPSTNPHTSWLELQQACM